MSREQILHGIILKKTPYRETDEIITLFTKEQGKVRVQARGVKKPTSKLQYALQALNEVTITTTIGTIAIITNAQINNTFVQIRESNKRITLFFWIAELVLKATPDEEPNAALYTLLTDALAFINGDNNFDSSTFMSAFILRFLGSIGLGVLIPTELTPGDPTKATLRSVIPASLNLLGMSRNLEQSTARFLDAGSGAGMTQEVFFSNSRGGFVQESLQDAIPVRPGVVALAQELRASDFRHLGAASPENELLFPLLSGFLTYQLERTINSTKFIDKNHDVV